MAGNPFDQFDGGKPAGNPFDQFDHPPIAETGGLLDAAARGFAQSASQPMDPETVQSLRDAGLFNDYQKGQQSLVRTFNEALVNQVVDPLIRRLPQGIYGAIRGMAEANPPDLIGKGISGAAGAATALMEAFPAGRESGLPVPAAEAPQPAAADLTANRAAVDALNPRGEQSATERVATPEPAVSPETPPPIEEAAPEAATPQHDEPAGPDLHAVARQIDPDLFSEYDALSAQKDTLRDFIADLAEQRDRGTSPAITDLDRQIDGLRAQRLDAPAAERAGLADQITALEDQRGKLVDALPKAGDTEDMALVRRDLQALDVRMRDLAPDVSAAYRRAAEEPLPAEAPVAEAPQPAEPPTAPEPVAEPQTPEAATPVPVNDEAVAAAAPAEGETVQPSAAPIAADVAKQLVDAGRPAEEADAAGALVQAHYEARAARFGGAKGSAEDLYRADAPTVRAARGARQPKATADLHVAQSRRGNIRLATDQAKAQITLFRDADASTFIHETGHQWLEELMSDAADERAPGELKSDAATVRQWLYDDINGYPVNGSIENGASRLKPLSSPLEIPRQAHEKFARGFERYMMEGHAPTASLAGVFGKFRDWLTKIYETVTRLRSPINDDIRGVFDRMLASKNEGEAVVAPEPSPTATFADVHETDAATTQPPEAAGVGDIVRSERDKVMEAAHPEVEDERVDARAAAADGGSGTGSGVSGEGGATARPDPASAGGVSQRGAIGEGRGNASAKGNRAPQPTGSAELGPPETRLVDRAGNIRLDNIDTPEDFKQALRDAAERNGDFVGRRRGVVSDAQRDALADVLGTTPDKVLTKAIGESFSDSEIKMLERALAQSSGRVRELAVRFAQTGAEADDLAATEALLRHDMLQGLYSQATAEAGRSFRALQKSKEYWSSQAAATEETLRRGLGDITGRSFNQRLALARKIATLDQAGQISRFVRDAQKPGLFDWVQSAFVNALLSGPFTHLGYTAAGEMFGLFRATAETGAAAGVGAVRRALGYGDAEHAQIGEVRAQVYGQMRGAWRGLKASWQAIKENQTVLPEEVQRSTSVAPGSGQPVTSGPRPTTIPNPRGIPIGTVLESPSRVVSALHTVNWTTFYEQSKAAQAFRIAAREGLRGDALSARIAHLVENPTDEIIKQASEEASAGALVTRPKFDSFMGRVSQVTNYGIALPDLKLPGGVTLPLGTLRPVKFIDPFVQIQANVQKAAFGRNTPFALFSQSVRDDLMMRNGGAAFDRAAGRIIAGTSFMAAAGGLYFAGLMNPTGPREPKEAALWRRVHGMPHGLTVGSLSYDMLRLGNLGLQMSVAADLAHAIDHIGKDDAAQVASNLVEAFAQNIVDESFARGPEAMMKATDDPDRYGASWIRGFVSSAMPFSVGLSQVAREVDPYTHRARTMMDALQAKIPFASRSLQPVYDIWGDPIPTRGWAGTYYEHVANDPVDRRLEQLGHYPSAPARHIGSIELNDQQYADYSRIAGRYARMQVEHAMALPGFASLPPEVQIKTIDSAISGARRQAAGIVTMQSAGSDNDLIAKKKAAIEAAVGGASHEQVKELKKVR